MKKYWFIFVALLFVCGSVCAAENDIETYNSSLKNQNIYIKDAKVFKNTKDIDIDFKKKVELFKNSPDLKEVGASRKPQSYSYNSNLILNSNFELGHSYWYELYKSFNGNWYDYDFIITSGSGGYDSWYAYISDSDWLVSNSYRTPSNVVDFRVTYKYRLVHWDCDSGSYGLNVIGVYLIDNTITHTYLINLHSAETDPYDYSYVSTSFFVTDSTSLQAISNHDIDIEFLHINDDPNCSFAFYLDNLTVEPVVYINDYTVTTSAGANGSITGGTTMAQGSNYTVTVSPNSGYRIEDVLVDGVTVGPVKYYTFTNLTASHTISASFSSNQVSGRVYRFWNQVDGDHFYTINDDEMTGIVNNYPTIWKYEGVSYNALSSSSSETTPLYRFWNLQNGQHFYTISSVEKDWLIATYPSIWQYENIAYYVYPLESSQGLNDVYRFWNLQNGQHFYTTNVTEKDWLIATYPSIWRYENLAWKVGN